MVSINIFGSNNNSLYDFNRDLDLNNNSVRNLKDPEDELDAANKRYVDSKLMLSPNGLIDNENGKYMGNLSLEADKEFSVFFGNNKNFIRWRNRPTQLLKFIAGVGFQFLFGRTPLLTISGASGIKAHKNIDLGSICRIINSQIPVDDSDCATKSYCDAKLMTTGGTMLGDLIFDGSTRNIHLGCLNLGIDNYFRFYLGSETNKVNSYNNGIDIFADRLIGLHVRPDTNIIVDAGGITFTKTLFMHGNVIKGLKAPREALDAVKKQYVDRKFDELNTRLQRLESNLR